MSTMNIGDLVRAKATWAKVLGIIVDSSVSMHDDEGWWVQWNDGARGFHHQDDLEVICDV